MRLTSPSAPNMLRASLRFMVSPPCLVSTTPPDTFMTSSGSEPSTCRQVSSLSQQLQLKKTRPAGSVTSLRVAPSGKSTKKRIKLSPSARPDGDAFHAPPVALTTTSPCGPTKLPPSQSRRFAYRPPIDSSPGKPRSTVSSEKLMAIGSDRRAPDAAHSPGIHVPGSRPTLKVTLHLEPASVADAALSSGPTTPAWLRSVVEPYARKPKSKAVRRMSRSGPNRAGMSFVRSYADCTVINAVSADCSGILERSNPGLFGSSIEIDEHRWPAAQEPANGVGALKPAPCA